MRHLHVLRLTAVVAAGALAWACGSAAPKPLATVDKGWTQKGIASWYGPKFHGRRTANGEIYDMYGITAAHKRLPFDTMVEVRNLDNGKRIQVRINDRGPFVKGRIIDLSYTAAERIGMIGPGTANVKIRVLGEAEVKGRYFTVQVAAYSSKAQARDLVNELEGRYPKVRLESVDGLHRVLVGKFAKQSKAKETAARLRRDGQEAFVRAEIEGR